jgi:hypothetical protein
MLMEIWYMIFLSAHLEISLLKFKDLTLGVDGQPSYPFDRVSLKYSWQRLHSRQQSIEGYELPHQ